MRCPSLVPGALLAIMAGCHGRRAAVPEDTGIEPGFRIPLVRPPGTPSPGGRDLDVPLTWIFVTDDPAPTGTAPNAIVGASLPCGFRAVYGTVSPPDAPTLGVRIHAVFEGSGDPRAAQCDTRPVSVQTVSLQRLRLNRFTVTDATPHGATDPPVPSVALRVVADDATTPAPMVRRYRSCAPGDDASCTAGGACGAFAGRTTGLCVPPMDPNLASDQPCPEGRAAITLTHAPMSGPVAPPDGVLHACVAACDDAHPCHASFECVTEGTHGVCLPR